ncbi:class I SAM-dependent methyltransferase [Marinicella gelatinilytica]|uniref:class I SAM-dependent methyltransferase n=1 Tax=Marinicella gelatinilytica TaxID=2996017 RepID=UPI002260DB7E|nr:methyltransferase domain-containing protein [Marinicella gelatinilytica]MCX7544118.1 methyltransferase domain-containing protein [Marinicella gelatinilytica]
MNHKHWTNYWENGAQTSLPHDFTGNYDGEIFDFWQQRVAELKSGDSVLDVCTGNGAVALLIAEMALREGKQLNITANDISEINTGYILKNNPPAQTDMIDFISQTPLEEINIDKPQDLIVSQYGLEYSDLNQSASSIARALKPNGQLVFIAHSPKSAVFSFMKNEQAIYDWLAEVGLWRVFQSYAEEELNSQQFKKNVLSILQSHRPNPVFRGEPLFTQWLQMIAQVRSSSTAELARHKTQIKTFVEQHDFARLRCRDMLKVSEKVSNENWFTPLIDYGFQLLEKKPLYYDSQQLVGDCYQFCLTK